MKEYQAVSILSSFFVSHFNHDTQILHTQQAMQSDLRV